MTAVVRCPACGQANRVPAVTAGKRAVCARCKASLDGGGNTPATLRDDDFAQQVAKGDWVVDFWAAWCGPCRIIGPVIEELAGERPSVRFGKLNVDENPNTAARFRVQGIPLLVFLRDGSEVGRVVGAVPKAQIEAEIGRRFGT